MFYRYPYISAVIFTITLISPVMAFSATAYKCVTENNVTVFSNKPCTGKQQEQIYIQDHFTEGETLRPDELKMLKEIEEREKQQQSDETSEPEITSAEPAKIETNPEIDQEACKKASDDLSEWQRIMKLGYKPEESENYITELNTRMQNKADKCGPL